MPAKEDKGDAVLAVHFIVEGIEDFYSSSKTEPFSLSKWVDKHVVKHLVEG